MKRNCDKAGQLLRSWRRGRASIEEIRTLASELGECNFAEGTPVLNQLLSHEDSIVRYNTVMSLGFDLKYRPATKIFLEMLKSDVDVDVRGVTSGALRTIWAGTKEPTVGAALCLSALNDPDEDVRKAAYKALLVIMETSIDGRLGLVQGPRGQVDTVYVTSILETISGTGANIKEP